MSRSIVHDSRCQINQDKSSCLLDSASIGIYIEKINHVGLGKEVFDSFFYTPYVGCWVTGDILHELSPEDLITRLTEISTKCRQLADELTSHADRLEAEVVNIIDNSALLRMSDMSEQSTKPSSELDSMLKRQL